MSGILVEGTGSHYSREEGVSGLPLNVHSNAYEAARVVKSGPGALYGVTVYNSNASAQFIQWHDAAVLPADGVAPAGFVKLDGATDRELVWIPPRSFLVGCVLCNSSTGPTKTIGSADCWFDVQYL